MTALGLGEEAGMPIRHPILSVLTVFLLLSSPDGRLSGTQPATQRPVDQAQTRVAVVDLPAVEKAFGVSIEAYQQQRLSPVNTKFEDMRAIQLRILKEKDTMDPGLSSQLQQQVQQLKKEIAQEEQAAFRDVQSRRTTQRAMLQEHLSKVATSRGFHVVLNRGESTVLWADPVIDVTADVIAAMTGPARERH